MTKRDHAAEAHESDTSLHRLEEFMRRVLSVPKKEIDAKLAKEKHKKHPKR
jgi:hypothetical protein